MESKPVIAIFHNSVDEARWSREIEGIPHLLRVMASYNFPIILDNLLRHGVNPTLIIMSVQVYRTAGNNHMQLIRRFFPDVEILLVATEGDAPYLKQIAANNIRHLIIRNFTEMERDRSVADGELCQTVKRIAAGTPLRISQYLHEGTQLREYPVTSTEDKEKIIAEVLAALPADSDDAELLREKGALLADEMLENAFYGAPRSDDGRQIFRKGEKRELFPSERILFRFGFDGDVLAMEVADSWGSLPCHMVLEHLAADQENQVASTEGGRGLFILWRFFDRFLVKITPGIETVVGGHVRKDSPLDPLMPKGFHICV